MHRHSKCLPSRLRGGRTHIYKLHKGSLCVCPAVQKQTEAGDLKVKIWNGEEDKWQHANFALQSGRGLSNWGLAFFISDDHRHILFHIYSIFPAVHEKTEAGGMGERRERKTTA